MSLFVTSLLVAKNRNDGSSEHGVWMICFASQSIQKIRKDPLVDLVTRAHRQIDKADAALSRGTGPTHLPEGLDAQAGKSQLKTQVDPLVLAQRTDGLYSHTLVAEVADDSSVGLVEGAIG